MIIKNVKLFLVITLFSLLFVPVYGAESLPSDLISVGVSENIKAQLDLSTQIITSEGKRVPMSEYFDGKTPVILNFVYYDCPMLCSLVLDGLVNAVKESSLKLGKDFKIITLSIDPNDKMSALNGYESKYTDQLTEETRAFWQFHLGSEDSIKALTSGVGFNYRFLPDSGEFAHSAALIVLTPEGQVSRYLYGIQYTDLTFKLAILEASKRRFISTLHQTLLFCYSYDPESRSYALHSVNLMKLSGGITIVLLLLFFLKLKRYDKVSQR
ncbi:MAG: SCO family protein [bacterium]|nr:SCO family protein [bacterium]